MAPPPEYAHLARSWQTSIGFARQIGNNIAFDADYVFTGSRNEKVGGGAATTIDNINLTYNPATGIPYPASDASHRAYPEWGVIGMYAQVGRSNYHGLQTSFTKRMSSHWQASATYTLSGIWNSEGLPFSGLKQVTFPVASDVGGEYTLAETDQRHRAVFNSIWQVSHGFQVSGIYFYGSGARLATTCGCDARGLAVGADRLRLNGTVIPRNSFVGQPIHRTELRLQQRVKLRGRAGIDAILEVFNVFNRANYGAYTTVESSPLYGQPAASTDLAYAPRTVQLGFRVVF
jgi:hypothetical protein